MKKVYGIGVGPGDRELITLKGYNLIKGCGIVFLPENRGESLAGCIAGDYIREKKVIKIEFPMGDDNRSRYIRAAELMEQEIRDGQYGVFLTLGDPMVYSTFLYLMMELEKRGVAVESVPGITSFCACASRVKVPVALKGERFYLCDGNIDDLMLESCDTVCILKTVKDKEAILDKLEAHGFDYVYIKRCTQQDEKLLYTREDIILDKDYMSMIIGRRNRGD